MHTRIDPTHRSGKDDHTIYLHKNIHTKNNKENTIYYYYYTMNFVYIETNSLLFFQFISAIANTVYGFITINRG